ncbi:HpcH/HpaI aldolase/citrate lyase family protein [Blastococcus sp. VKM Ac-2987]|uniref:HpcH/HpaI aldolase/citrate lyase family protein n=1 Tax=Blastococcus sp. VKM Ac-2987 TaxID=3004141 RepID=UPI0022AB6C9A|nr:CoA ester lyase [Blastococcus sp. VKM Ac-2987]MCZ2857863.1 CoA ester lyase [Blastococcus sp. VKM Ac-2987]
MPGTELPLRRRSVLVAPGSDAPKVAKALSGSADAVVIDLEDAVEPASKDRARALLPAHLGNLTEGGAGRTAVRVNPPGSPWCHLDVAALVELPVPPGAIVLPKVDGPEDLAFLDRLLDGVEARAGSTRRIAVHALIETATGLARIRDIARGSRRLEALVLGYADLANSLGRPGGSDAQLDLWLPAQSAVLVAARDAGLQAIDGPHLGVHVDEGFRVGADRARDLGYDGKWAIHPRQVEALNAVFTPTDEQIRYAREVLAALARHAREHGAGAVALDGQMLDEAVAVGARRVLRQAGVRL